MAGQSTAATRATIGDRVRQALVLLTLVAVLGMNTAAGLLPLFGVSTAQVSNDFPTRFTPAGWTFSVWSVIYLGLIGYAVHQLLPEQATNPRHRRIGWLFVVNGAANIGWLVAWHSYQLAVSVLIMLVILSTLILIYRGLERDRPPLLTLERWLLDVPFSLYLAWITIATIANIAITLTAAEWGAWGIAPEVWSALMIAVGGGLAAYVAFTRRDFAWAAVVVWALFGIMSGQADAALVVSAARVLAAIIALAFAAGAVRSMARDASTAPSG